jgi:hypothetical protein
VARPSKRWLKTLAPADQGEQYHNSALANALGGPNPTVTCQALATRTAEKVFFNEFGGDPFVANLSQTVSTDRSITAALPPELL